MSKEKETIIEKVLTFIKADDKTLVSATQKSILSEAKNQIEDAIAEKEEVSRKSKRKQADLQAKLEDAQTQCGESFMQIELVKNSDDRKTYIRTDYLQQIANAKGKVDSLAQAISDEVESTAKKLVEIDEQIATWTELQEFWSGK